jgi:hypothetical protein
VHPQVVLRTPFDATAGFYNTAKTVLQTSGNFNLNLLNYERATIQFCAQDWNQMLTNPKYASELDYIYSDCYAATEQLTLLKMLGFKAGINNITAVSTINGNSVNWTIGIVVDKAMNP